METTFHDKEYVLAEKISYRLGNPQRGDVVILKFPYNTDVDYIKRIIGLPGDTVSIVEGKVYINFKSVNEPYLDSPTTLDRNTGNFMSEGKDITVPEGKYFIMGDNRPHSSDSRFFGPIERKLIIGKVVFRYWPLNRFGLIKRPSYTYGD